MKQHLRLGMAVMLALGVVATAFCAEPAAKPDSTKTGVVKKVDMEGKTITVLVTRELTFTITADTKIRQGEAAKTLADIQVGDTVMVIYARDGEKRVASAVTIAASAPAVPPAPAPAIPAVPVVPPVTTR